MYKSKVSKGQYKFRKDARTFKAEFYYINFLDKNGVFDAEYSEEIENRFHATNRVHWLAKNSWALSDVEYRVAKIGLYSSRKGHVLSVKVE
jgi:hypothetical protein